MSRDGAKRRGKRGGFIRQGHEAMGAWDRGVCADMCMLCVRSWARDMR